MTKQIGKFKKTTNTRIESCPECGKVFSTCSIQRFCSNSCRLRQASRMAALKEGDFTKIEIKVIESKL